jgi:glycosyltransferase involved in cell wall biosynthesis
MRKIKVLFVSNVSVWGGSVKSLYQTISTIKNDSNFEPFLMIPNGSASKYFESVAEVINVHAIPQFDNTLYGNYRGFRWLLLLRETYAYLKFIFSLIGSKQKQPYFDIIHFNEIVCFVPCVYLLKKIYPNAKIVTHVRSLQSDKKGFRNKLFKRVLENKADHIFCIDKIVANTLPASVQNKTTILYNINNADSGIKEVVGKKENKVNLIFLGGSSYMKGAGFLSPLLIQLDALNVCFSLTVLGIEEEPQSGLVAVFNNILSFIGIKQSLSVKDFISSLKSFQPKYEIQLIPFQNDINSFLKNSDILIFPSYLDAPGRPSIEAMSYGIPSVIFCNDKENDVVLEGITGFNVPNRDLKVFAEKISYLYKHPDVMSEFQKNCLKHYKDNFLSSSHLLKLSSVYNTLLFNHQLINK